MKTLYEFLIDENTKKVRHKELDNLAIQISRKADEEKIISEETYKAMFRFSVCTLHFMAEELCPNEITWGSFFKLLMCEVDEDGNKPEDKVTVYDILLDEASEKSAVIYQLHEFYIAFEKYMPNCKLFYDSIELACEELEIEFNRDFVQMEIEAWIEKQAKKEAERTQKIMEEEESPAEEKVSGYKQSSNIQINDIMLVKDLMRHLNVYQQTFVESSLQVAWRLVNEIKDEDLKDIFRYFLSDYEDFGPVMEAVREYGENM